MSSLGQKISFSDALGVPAILVTGAPITFWFYSWAKPTGMEIAGLIACSALLHIWLMHAAFYLHESRSPVRRYLREFRETGNVPAELRSMDPIQVRSSLDRWASTRTAWISAAFFLRDFPGSLYISHAIVPRMPNPEIGSLFQYMEWTAYLAISVVLILIEQKIRAGKLRRDLLEAGFDRGIRDDILSWRVLQELGRVEIVMSATALMFIVSATYILLHPTVVGWPDHPENYRLLVVFGGGAAALCLLWLRQFRLRDYLVRKMGDYEREARWNLDRDIELHRLSSLGQMAGLVLHDLVDQVATLKIAGEAILKRARPGDPNVTGFNAAIAHMQDLLVSLRAKIRDDRGLTGASSSDLSDCVAYAMTLLRASEGSLVISKLGFSLDPRLREVRIAMPKTDLIQVMTNLGSNAVRAMQDLDAGVVSLELADLRDGFVTLAMSDNGSGLSRTRFEQLTAVSRLGDDSVKIREGLGLRLVCRMVERSGGKVSVDSKSGPGATRIYIKLPLA